MADAFRIARHAEASTNEDVMFWFFHGFPAFLSATRSRTRAALAAALEQLLHSPRHLAGNAPRGHRIRCQADGLDHPDAVLLQYSARRLPHGTREYGLAILQQFGQFVPTGCAATGLRGFARLH